MADTNLSTGASRRAILKLATTAVAYTAGAAIVTGGMALASEAHGETVTASTTERATWDRGLVAIERARKADEAFDAIYMRTFEAYSADFPDADTISLSAFPVINRHVLLHAEDLDEFERNYLAGKGGISWSEAPEPSARAAIEAVRNYRRLRAEADARHDMTAIDAEWERLGQVLYDAKWQQFEMPAPDLAALGWKSEHLFGDSTDHDASSCSWSGDIMTIYMADVRRLTAREA